MTNGTGTTGRAGIAELLARRLADAGRGGGGPFTVAELRRSLLPYPLCRSELELATKAEYDVALLRLLHEDGLLESDDPELDDGVERELASPEPALGVLDDHAAAALRPGPRLREALRADRPSRAEPTSPTGEEETSAPDDGTTSAPDEEPPSGPRGSSDGGDDRPSGSGRVGVDGDARAAGVVSGVDGGPTAAGACPACGGDVPGAEGVQFCPHCGAGLEAPRCGQCGGEMAAGWRYCPFCGSERHE